MMAFLLHVCTHTHTHTTTFILKGRVFRDINLPGVPPAERHALYVAMVTTLVQLHVIDWCDLGLANFGNKGDYAQRQVQRSCTYFFQLVLEASIFNVSLL